MLKTYIKNLCYKVMLKYVPVFVQPCVLGELGVMWCVHRRQFPTCIAAGLAAPTAVTLQYR